MYKGPVEAPLMAGLPQAPAAAAAVQAVPAPVAAAPAQPPADSAARALSVYVDDTPKARNEAWARLHGDPMLMVRSLCKHAVRTAHAPHFCARHAD